MLEKLLDIGSETKLLVEIKDILDEINIILNILRAQNSVLSDPGLEQYRNSSHYEDARRIITTSTTDFERMNVQAEGVRSSVSVFAALVKLKIMGS